MSGFFQLFKLSMIIVVLITIVMSLGMCAGQISHDQTDSCKVYREKYHQMHC